MTAALHPLHAAILGVVEGLTEFIPVSSTGHLIVARDLLGLSGAKVDAFLVFIQLGAILAVLWHYRAMLLGLLAGWRRLPAARRLLLNLVAGTLPAVVIGLPTDDWIEAHLFKTLPVCLAFIAGGLAILWVERRFTRPAVATLDEIPLARAAGVGLVQVLAILWPGISRSGATILGGLGLGLSRRAATEFSFLLAVPALLGAGTLKLWGVRGQLAAADLPGLSIGFLVSFAVALLVIRGLLAYVSRRSFAPFAWYRLAAGAAGLLLLAW